MLAISGGVEFYPIFVSMLNFATDPTISHAPGR